MDDKLQPGVRFYVSLHHNQIGPLTEEVIRESVRAGQYTADTLSWKEGSPSWIPLSQTFPYLFLGAASATPPAVAPAVASESVGSAATKAALGPRTAGLLIDWAILLVGFAILGIVVGAVSAGVGGVVIDILASPILILYPTLTLGSAMQATPGMKLTKVRMVTVQGKRVDYMRAFLRSLMSVIFCPVLIGWLWAFWDPQQQTLHDKFAGTLVIKA